MLGACRSGSLSLGEHGHGAGGLVHHFTADLPGQQEAHGPLDVPGGDGRAVGLAGQAAGLAGDAIQHVMDEGVHDARGLLGQGEVLVKRLQHPGEIGGKAATTAGSSVAPWLLLSLLGRRVCPLGLLGTKVLLSRHLRGWLG